MLKVILFDTKLGEWILAQLEARAGLALVPCEWLAQQQVALVDGGQPGPVVGEVATQSTITIIPQAVMADKGGR